MHSEKMCSELELKTSTTETEVCGFSSLPDELVVNILANVSRLDLMALGIVSRRQRYAAATPALRDLRYLVGTCDPYLYVFMHLYPDPIPRWFILHPMQRRLKPVHSSLVPVPEAGSCFVFTDWGICSMGGLVDGKPTSEVWFFDCIDHTLYPVSPMKMARSGASASLVDGKIYVFGGCGDDVADSSNWAEVFDFETETWELLSVSTSKTPLKIQQSVVVMEEEEEQVYAVDEDGQFFSFSPSKRMFVADGETESNPEYRNHWLYFDQVLFCRGTGGRILWRLPCELDWKEVKGLEELQQRHSGYDIIKLCIYSAERIVIFWKALPHQTSGKTLTCYMLLLSMPEYSQSLFLGIFCACDLYNLQLSRKYLRLYNITNDFLILYAKTI
ncbi:unnamed protein product [Thlaspi arvense]|uniref:F-box domain-containing protein n=1 Tax=Thlaspi arvense TaxID=13288 RepID=A0AAU9RVZ5_THLAR|nr:unnamed protein product [Thlaspi arvense]